MALTTHYVDESWVLKKRVLKFLNVDVPHNADNLAHAMMSCLMEWNIDGKLYSMSFDNCSNNDCLSNIVGKQLTNRGLLLGDGTFFHVHCAAHILNLIFLDAWKALGVVSKKKEPNLLNNVRDSVKFVTSSQKREKMFNEAMRQFNITCKRSLFLDCSTRWNSTHDMLMVALEYKDAFDCLGMRDPKFDITITSQEWDMVKVVTNFLETFKKLTKIFSGTSYPTSNLFFHQICELNLSILG